MRNRNEEYWKAAAVRREQEAHTAAEEALKQMLRLYDDALDDINSEIDKIKSSYQARFGIDEETAERYISRELRNYNMESLTQELLETGSEEERNAILNFIHLDGLSTRAYGARTERYESLKNNIALRMIRLETALRAVGEGIRKDAYTGNYYRVIDDTAKGLDAGISFRLIDDAALDEVMSKSWHGKRFSTRIWDNTDRLAKEAQEIVGRYIVSGRSLNKAAEELAGAFEAEKFHATTLIHTEVAHARSMSDARAYEEIGAEYYRYMATLDEVTCDVCGPLDGQVFRLDERAEGKNYPVMHPRCRCTTTFKLDWKQRSARNMVTGRNEKIDGSVTYEQWRDGMTDEEKAAFDKAQRKYRNKAADKQQHEKYREIFSKDVPRSLDKFQELKYNNVKEWNTLKSQKQSRLNQMEFSDMSELVGKLGNKEVRLWYKAHDENIINLIDTSKALEEQARQACDLRNRFKYEARELMKDQKMRKSLDEKEPYKSFEYLVNRKITLYGLSGDDVYKDILRSSGTTNKQYDKKAGL